MFNKIFETYFYSNGHNPIRYTALAFLWSLLYSTIRNQLLSQILDVGCVANVVVGAMLLVVPLLR